MYYTVSVYRLHGSVAEHDPIYRRSYGHLQGGRLAWRAACRQYDAIGEVAAPSAMSALDALVSVGHCALLSARTDDYDTGGHQVDLTVQLGECSTASEEG